MQHCRSIPSLKVQYYRVPRTDKMILTDAFLHVISSVNESSSSGTNWRWTNQDVGSSCMFQTRRTATRWAVEFQSRREKRLRRGTPPRPYPPAPVGDSVQAQSQKMNFIQSSFHLIRVYRNSSEIRLKFKQKFNLSINLDLIPWSFTSLPVNLFLPLLTPFFNRNEFSWPDWQRWIAWPH